MTCNSNSMIRGLATRGSNTPAFMGNDGWTDGWRRRDSEEDWVLPSNLREPSYACLLVCSLLGTGL